MYQVPSSMARFVALDGRAKSSRSAQSSMEAQLDRYRASAGHNGFVRKCRGAEQ